MKTHFKREHHSATFDIEQKRWILKQGVVTIGYISFRGNYLELINASIISSSKDLNDVCYIVNQIECQDVALNNDLLLQKS